MVAWADRCSFLRAAARPPSESLPMLRRPRSITDPAPPTLIVYSRQDCHLCDVALEVIEELHRTVAFDVEVRDVDDDPAWRASWGLEVPVGFIGERKVFKYRVDAGKLARALQAPR
jgi:hypothetical protein